MTGVVPPPGVFGGQPQQPGAQAQGPAYVPMPPGPVSNARCPRTVSIDRFLDCRPTTPIRYIDGNSTSEHPLSMFLGSDDKVDGKEHRMAQLATVDQQRELMRYMGSLNDWLSRDVQDRQAELRAVTARIDQLRDDLGRLGIGAGPGQR